jgi:hypothetical protein
MIKLLSTDFDGTLVNHDVQPTVEPQLFELLAELRRDGVLWAINTGRVLQHALEGLEHFRFPFAPDFILASEREVFRPSTNGAGWEDFGDWNRRCAERHRELFVAARPIVEEIMVFLQTETRAEPIHEDATFIGLVASSHEEMDRVVAFVERVRVRLPAFNYQRNTQYLRFCHIDYDKGAALGELARLTGIARDEIFAAGDHYNDIPMLDGRYARWSACPANSVAEVKSTVGRAGGYVAGRDCSGGVVEALTHFAARSRPGTRPPDCTIQAGR